MPGMLLIKKGEDFEFTFDLDGDDISGWICTIFLRQFPKSLDLIIPRVIPPIGNEWQGLLTSTETAALEVSSISPYYLIGLLTNASTDQQREIQKRVHVQPTFI